MAVYATIREVRRILNDLYGPQDHSQTRQMLGLNKNLYNQLRYYDTVIVAEKITPEIQGRLEDFISLHREKIREQKKKSTPPTPAPQPIPPPESEESIPEEEEPIEELIKPKEPYEIYVNNDVNNPGPVKLTGKALNMVNAMTDLRKAMDPFFEMGYHIGVRLYRLPPPEEVD